MNKSARYRIFTFDGVECASSGSFDGPRPAIRKATIKVITEPGPFAIWMCQDGKKPTALAAVVFSPNDAQRFSTPMAMPSIELRGQTIVRPGGAS